MYTMSHRAKIIPSLKQYWTTCQCGQLLLQDFTYLRKISTWKHSLKTRLTKAHHNPKFKSSMFRFLPPQFSCIIYPTTYKGIFMYLKNDIKQIKVEKKTRNNEIPRKHLIVLVDRKLQTPTCSRRQTTMMLGWTKFIIWNSKHSEKGWFVVKGNRGCVYNSCEIKERNFWLE